MDTELLVQRSKIIKSLRDFFEQENFLEVDTPALSPTLIPETCLEVFKTFYHKPDYQNHPAENNSSLENENIEDLYLVPSPEVYIKPLIAKHKLSVFQNVTEM